MTMALENVQDRLSELVDQVERDHDRVVITRNGIPAAVLMSVDDLASLDETLEVLNRPQLLGQVRDSLAECADDDVAVCSREDMLGTLRS